jgi:hypothetical protein
VRSPYSFASPDRSGFALLCITTPNCPSLGFFKDI